MKKLWTIVMLAFILLTALSNLSFGAGEEVKRITKEELRILIEGAAVVVVDVRADGDWNGSKTKIKGAVREDPNQVGAWMGKYGKDRTLVFYCA